MRELDVRVVRRHALNHDLAPQFRAGQDVLLIDRAHLAAARPRQIEGVARHALDLFDRVAAGIHAGLCGELLGTEVQATGELADDDHVEAVNELGAEGRDELLRPHADRADVGERLEFRTQREETLFGTDLAGVPLRAANGAFQHGISVGQRLTRLGGERIPMRVDGVAAEGVLGALSGEAVGLAGGREDGQRDARGLWADAVAGEDCDLHVMLRSRTAGQMVSRTIGFGLPAATKAAARRNAWAAASVMSGATDWPV